ncbi:MAG TPA: hypothetical protein VN843_29265 [Anaerolineales bacterium]|nr:hypothetical protein [Anaerolineales bacterium]
MKFSQNQRVYSEVYGAGTVIHADYSRRGTEQYGIKFDNGGPQGWAENATNDIDNLVAIQ